MKPFIKLFAVIAAAISLSACVGAAIVPTPVASATTYSTYSYPDGYSYPYPSSVYYETYRIPR